MLSFPGCQKLNSKRLSRFLSGRIPSAATRAAGGQIIQTAAKVRSDQQKICPFVEPKYLVQLQSRLARRQMPA